MGAPIVRTERERWCARRPPQWMDGVSVGALLLASSIVDWLIVDCVNKDTVQTESVGHVHGNNWLFTYTFFLIKWGF